MFVRFIAALILVGSLVGCATAPRSIDAQTSARVKRIAIVVAVSNTAHVSQLGLMWINDDRHLNVADWHLEKEIGGAIVEHFKTSHPDKTIVAINDTIGPGEASAFIDSVTEEKPAGGRIAEFFAKSQADVGLVITTTSTRLAVTGAAVSGRDADNFGLFILGSGDLAYISPFLALDTVVVQGTGNNLLARTQWEASGFDEQGRLGRSNGKNTERFGPPSALFQEASTGPRYTRLHEDLSRFIKLGIPQTMRSAGF